MMLRRVSATSFPYHYNHDLYQEYYWRCLEQFCRHNPAVFVKNADVHLAGLFRALRALRFSYKLHPVSKLVAFHPFVDTVARLASCGRTTRPVSMIGYYTFRFDEFGDIPVCIDSRDSHECSLQDVNQCALYFKTNYWQGINYPPNVVPLPNMNPYAGRNLSFLRSLRNADFRWDLFAFVRVWGGIDEVSGIDHNITLLCELNKVPCRSFILAYLVSGDIESQKRRLDDLGIRWTTRPMPITALWKMASQSRLNLIRMGMHECTPWRLIDILAMGRVPMFDYHPKSLWPVQLVDRHNFLTLNFKTGHQTECRSIPDFIEDWLADPQLMSKIGVRNASYFDQNLAPEKMGESIVQRIQSFILRPEMTGVADLVP